MIITIDTKEVIKNAQEWVKKYQPEIKIPDSFWDWLDEYLEEDIPQTSMVWKSGPALAANLIRYAFIGTFEEAKAVVGDYNDRDTLIEAVENDAFYSDLENDFCIFNWYPTPD